MIAAIGLDRRSAYITNILPWRPPENRKPTAAETTAFVPFVNRHIALVGPRVLVLVGGTAATALLGTTEGITKLRGRWLVYRDETSGQTIDTMAIYHPAYLLRQSALKREAWRDLLAIKARLDGRA
jgi:DNA polymerase